jgi:hypothetical protein
MAADGGQQQRSVYGRVELRDGYLVSLGVSESASILITVFSHLKISEIGVHLTFQGFQVSMSKYYILWLKRKGKYSGALN